MVPTDTYPSNQPILTPTDAPGTPAQTATYPSNQPPGVSGTPTQAAEPCPSKQQGLVPFPTDGYDVTLNNGIGYVLMSNATVNSITIINGGNDLSLTIDVKKTLTPRIKNGK